MHTLCILYIIMHIYSKSYYTNSTPILTCLYPIQEKLGEEYVLKKKPSSSKARKQSKASTNDHTTTTAVVEVHTETEKVKRKRSNSHSNSSGNSIAQHKINQKDWSIHPRTFIHLPHTLSLPQNTMKKLVKYLTDNSYSEPFLTPVDPRDAPGYLDLIETPMDIGGF